MTGGEREEREREKIMPSLMATSLRWRTHSARTKNFRIQAQVIHFSDYRLLWMNAYFPTDPQLVNFDQTELLQVQNEIENIMDTTEFDDVLLGGDFNYDKRRLSSFTISMDLFLERLGFKSVWGKFPVDFTHIHTDMKSTPILDNFFMNDRLLGKVVDAGVLHLGDNRSRHFPIMLKL
jgi:hypothetical protein